MTLNIRDAEADRLIRELAEATHLPFAEVLVTALREKLAREKGRRRSVGLAADVARIQQRIALHPRSPGELIRYDEHGLPRKGR